MTISIDGTTAAALIFCTLIIGIAFYSVLTDSNYNETKRKLAEEETKRLLHGDS